MDGPTTWTTELDPRRASPAATVAEDTAATVRHPGWCGAYGRLMTELLAGPGASPAFFALLGPAGTGKTWLLQAVAAALRQRGQPVILVRRGELPIEVAPGTVILVDEAARMEDGPLARLAGVCDASIVLADLPVFAARLERLARPPAIILLAPLRSEDMPGFAAAWLASRGVPADTLTPAAAARLSEHSEGVPRLAVQLLRAALAMTGPSAGVWIGADLVDEVAALRLGGFDAGSAVAAGPADGEDLAHADPSAPGSAPALAPDVQEADPAGPARGTSGRPRAVRGRAGQAAAWGALAASLLVAAVLAASYGQLPFGRREGSALPSAHAAWTDAGDRAPTAAAGQELPSPARLAAPEARLPSPPPADTGRTGRAGGAPGLVLVAKAGDTMTALYAKVYRGVRPPPYADVAAANHMPIRPGALVVFPAPLDGWPER